ncbi:GDSL-type esterase/lipase family protein [Streptomyces sp. NPDC090442]|uniref:GDSL-type esterase/lipase family protein n=1 Tax=Streptomyces sp. NPDC090442 TaxID=3365962 RepID=UPI0038130731
MGDSFISGEAGRWYGNAAPLSAGHRYGTDRAANNCWEWASWCSHDPSTIYGDSHRNGCHRSDTAPIMSTDLGPGIQRINLACSGATTHNILRLASGGLPFKGEEPQADQLARTARTHDIKLIVLSIGGNDLGFTDLITDCVKGFMTPTGNWRCASGQDGRLGTALQETRAKVARTLDDIRAVMRQAGYSADSYRLVLQSYPSPVPRGGDNRYPETYTRFSTGGCPLFNDDATWARDSVVPRIATMLKDAAREANAQFLDLQDAFDGKEVCSTGTAQATSEHTPANRLPSHRAEWVRFLIVMGSQGTAQESIHPNAYGQQALGHCLTLLWHQQPHHTYTCRNTPHSGPHNMKLQATHT